MIRSVLGVGADPEECSWKEWSGLAGWLKLLSGMMTMMLYPDVKVIAWEISEKGQKCHKQTLRENKQGKIFAKENATGREGETEMIFSVFGGSLISFVMWNPSFNLPLSLSDQNSENKNFTQILRKIPVGNRHLNEIWREVQFQWTNKTRHVYTPIVTKLQLEILLKSHWNSKMCLASFWLNHIKSRSVARCMLRRWSSGAANQRQPAMAVLTVSSTFWV